MENGDDLYDENGDSLTHDELLWMLYGVVEGDEVDSD